MPGGDGTGPVGMGPMTGRRAGFCRVRGFRRMRAYAPEVNEKEFLGNQVEYLENQLQQVKKRLEALDEEAEK